MLRADRLTVIHNDDTKDDYTDVHYSLHRYGVRIHTGAGEVVFTEVLTVLAAVDRPRKAASTTEIVAQAA